MKASSQYDSKHAPFGGRLNYHAQFNSLGDITQIGGWVPLTADQDQWLQIKFSQIFQISGVATQGRADEAQWVKSYKLEYSTDGSTWTYYPNVRVLPLNAYCSSGQNSRPQKRTTNRNHNQTEVFLPTLK